MAERPGNDVLLDVRGLRAAFGSREHPVTVVDGLTYRVRVGEAVAIVGESGSGKTIGVRALLGLMPREAFIAGGSAMFDGHDLLTLADSELRKVRGRRIAMVFQNSASAMNPTLTLERQLTEHIMWHGLGNRTEARLRAIQALGDVGITEPERRIRMYPFQLSGGMRQRAMIAMAIATAPDLLIADEPTTGLDVTLQRQILDLLADFTSRGMGVLMITHDLGVARYLCDETVVMYSGQIMERAPTAALLAAPVHPYTIALVDASLEVGAGDRQLRAIGGMPPNPRDRPTGCPFHPRCPVRDAVRCLEPQALSRVGASHDAACWRAGPSDA